MQLFCSRWRLFFCRQRSLFVAAILSFLAIGAGCVERPTTIDPPFSRPYSGVTLTVAASDPADRVLLQQLSKSWATRSGAQVRVLDTPWDGNADIGLIAPAELAEWAESGKIADVQSEVRLQTHAYRWDDLLRPYSVRLTNWRDRTCALPVVGEGMVLVYRRSS